MTVVVASSPTEVTFTVPLLAVTGKVSFTTADGNATAATRLTVIPEARSDVRRCSLTGYWRLSAASRAGEKADPRVTSATHEAPRGMSHHPVAKVAPVCLSRRGDCPRPVAPSSPDQSYRGRAPASWPSLPPYARESFCACRA